MKHLKQTVAFCGVVAAVLSMESRSIAQTVGTESVSALSQQLRQGIRLEDEKWVLKPRFSFGMGLDQNVYLAPDGTESVSDYYYQLIPGAEFLYGTLQHNYFVFRYDFIDHSYLDESNEDFQDHRFEGALHFETGKTTFHLRDAFVYEYGSDLEAGLRLDRTRNVLSADIEHRVSPKTSIAGIGSMETVNFDEDMYVDHTEYRGGLRLYYEALPKTDFFGDMTYGMVRPSEPRFNHVVLRGVPDNYADADYQEYSVGTRYRASVKSILIARVGYQFRQFESDKLDDTDTWIMALQANSQMDELTSVGLEASRRIVPSITESGRNFFNTRLGGHVRRTLFDRNISGIAAISYEQSEFQDEQVTKYRTDDYWSYSAGLDWKVNEFMSLGCEYWYTTNSSTEADKDVARDVFLLSAKANY